MNIGYIIPELGDNSSVSIESLKWMRILEDMGHNVHKLTGILHGYLPNTTVLSEISSETDMNKELFIKLFNMTHDSNNQIQQDVIEYSSQIEFFFNQWSKKKAIELIIIENYFSLPINLVVTHAMYNWFKKNTCKKIIRHHDACQKNRLVASFNHPFIQELILNSFSINAPNITHVSTNQVIKDYLRETSNINALIIPYVLDDSVIMPTYTNNNPSKTLITTVFLSNRTSLDRYIDLVSHINDPSFKLSIICKVFKEYDDYLLEIEHTIKLKKLSNRIAIYPENMLDKNTIHTMFRHAQGVLSLDHGMSYSLPVLYAIQNKTPLIFCPKTKMKWLEMDNLDCKSVEISADMTDLDIKTINHYINSNISWADHNFNCLKKVYSMNMLRHYISNIIKAA